MPSTESCKSRQCPFIRPDMFPKLITPLTDLKAANYHSFLFYNLLIKYLNKTVGSENVKR